MSDKEEEQNPCGGCHKETNDTLSIKCFFCQLWFHRKCTGLDEDCWKAYKKLSDKGHKEAFKCVCCTSAWTGISDKIVANRKDIDKLQKKTKDQDKRLEKQQKVLDNHDERLEDQEKAIADLQEDLQNNTVHEQGNFADTVAAASRAAVAELREIEARKNNVVFLRLSELDIAIKDPAQRKAHDESKLEEILGVINCEDAKDDIKKMFRAGKIRENNEKPRPLIIHLNSNKQREAILSNAKLLANSAFKKVSIQPDLTKAQQQEDNRLYDKAKKKNDEMDEEEAKNWTWRPWGVPGSKTLRKLELAKMNKEVDPSKKKD